MKIIFSLVLLVLIVGTSIPQTTYTDILLENSVYSSAPIDVQQTKAFIRQRWFFEQRAFPNNYIPENAYSNSITQSSKC